MQKERKNIFTNIPAKILINSKFKFRIKMKNKPTIGLINFGCPKNLVDSENMLGILSQNGYEINLNEEKADIILVNTCAFIKDAEKESVKAIVELAQSGKKLLENN